MPEDPDFGEFFASQFGPLRRLGFWLTGDWGEAEELAQDALVRTYRRWRRVRRYDRPEDYARKVLLNRHRTLLRRTLLEARYRSRDHPEETSSPDSRDDALVLWATTLKLPPRQRAVLVLRYREDLTEAAVARLLGIPVGTVKTLTHRGLVRLRRELVGPMGLLLVPTRPSPGPLPATIMVHTDVLDPLIYPGPRPSTPSDSPVLTSDHPVPGGPFTKGRRADGRRFVRSDHANQLAGAWEQRYELVWPYKCAAGVRCPWEARYRSLLAEAASPLSERAATQAALRRVVETARPIGNAVAPQPVAARRPCRIPDQRLHSSPDVELQTPNSEPRDAREVGLEVEFRMSSSVVSCRLRQRVRLELWQDGRPANVRGNGSTVEFDGALPEGSGGSGWIAAAWRWRTGAADRT
jgi:RNA polymerase sigma-70 factor (sigma-E family)